MRKFKVLKLPNVSESASPIFYKRKRYTKVLFNKMFFPKNGGKRFALSWAFRIHPHFLKKNSVEKNCCVSCAFVKNGTAFFWDIWLTTIWICACLSIFSLQKDWIRVMWTFIASKKVNPCSFCACVLLQKNLICFPKNF